MNEYRSGLIQETSHLSQSGRCWASELVNSHCIIGGELNSNSIVETAHNIRTTAAMLLLAEKNEGKTYIWLFRSANSNSDRNSAENTKTKQGVQVRNMEYALFEIHWRYCVKHVGHKLSGGEKSSYTIDVQTEKKLTRHWCHSIGLDSLFQKTPITTAKNCSVRRCIWQEPFLTWNPEKLSWLNCEITNPSFIKSPGRRGCFTEDELEFRLKISNVIEQRMGLGIDKSPEYECESTSDPSIVNRP